MLFFFIVGFIFCNWDQLKDVSFLEEIFCSDVFYRGFLFGGYY